MNQMDASSKNQPSQDVLLAFEQLSAEEKYRIAIEILRRLKPNDAIENAIQALHQKTWPVEPTYPLRGKPVSLEQPFGPAIPLDDWSVYQGAP